MLEKQKQLLQSGKTVAQIIGDAVGDFVAIGKTAFKKLGLRRTGGGLNNPNGRKGQVLMLPFGPKLEAFVAEMPKVTTGGVEWYKLVCEDANGYLVGIPINRLCERYIADKRDEGDPNPRPEEVGTESSLTAYFVGPSDDICLQNLCDHLAGRAIKINDVMTETRILSDGTTARGRRWNYELAPDDEQPKFQESLLWVLMNWDQAKQEMTKEEQEDILDQAKQAGIDVNTITGCDEGTGEGDDAGTEDQGDQDGQDGADTTEPAGNAGKGGKKNKP
jgi:hypothetical protein